LSTPIFTPTNEPYLGRELLFQFDNLISSCLELNTKCAPASHNRPLSRLQRALCILVPQTITLALSVRELIRQGYLFGAKVLMRPVTERAVTILYLFRNPGALQIWDDGWKHNRRPNLQAMVEYLNKELLQDKFQTVKGFAHDLNSATHGDPLSAQWNAVLGADGVPVFPVSKNLCSPQLADEICAEVIPWLAATMGIMAPHLAKRPPQDPTDACKPARYVLRSFMPGRKLAAPRALSTNGLARKSSARLGLNWLERGDIALARVLLSL
jgi:hypothetical protein